MLLIAVFFIVPTICVVGLHLKSYFSRDNFSRIISQLEITYLRGVSLWPLVFFSYLLCSFHNELLVEEIRLKYHSNLIPDKWVLSTPQSILAAPFHKRKPHGSVGVGIDECAFCKEKHHCKLQYPILLKASKKIFKIPSSNIVVAPPTTIGSGFDLIYPTRPNSTFSRRKMY